MINQVRGQSQSFEFEDTYNQFDISFHSEDSTNNQTMDPEQKLICKLTQDNLKKIEQCLVTLKKQQQSILQPKTLYFFLQKKDMFILKVHQFDEKVAHIQFASNQHQCSNEHCKIFRQIIFNKIKVFKDIQSKLISSMHLKSYSIKVKQRILQEQIMEEYNLNDQHGLFDIFGKHQDDHTLRAYDKRIQAYLSLIKQEGINPELVIKLNLKMKLAFRKYEQKARECQFQVSSEYLEQKQRFKEEAFQKISDGDLLNLSLSSVDV